MSLLGWALVSLAAIWSAAFLGAYCGIAAFFLLRERAAQPASRYDLDTQKSKTQHMPADAC